MVAAAALGVLLLAACFSLDRSQRRGQLETLLRQPPVLVVVDSNARLRLVTLETLAAPAAGFREGDRWRAEFHLPSAASGFAGAFVEALRRKPGLATAQWRVIDLSAAGRELQERGASPVLFAHTGEWTLAYDLSLRRFTMDLWFNVNVSPADRVAAGKGALALPDRLWSGNCSFRGPEEARPMEVWRAGGGALLHLVLGQAQQRCGQRMADLLSDFLEQGKEQGAFDFGDLPEQPVPAEIPQTGS